MRIEPKPKGGLHIAQEPRPESTLRPAKLSPKALPIAKGQRPESTLRPATTQSTPFRFLDLPPEIRNAIYLTASPVAYLRSSSNGKLASRTSLPRVSRQIREEFLPILYLRAHIVAKISKFNFSHIITFLNNLPSADLQALTTPSPHEVDGLRRYMLLSLSTDNTWIPRVDACMIRWLNRIDEPTKKGFGIDIQYAADPAERGWWHWWAKHFKAKGVRSDWSERKVVELTKIVTAFEEEY